MFEIYMQVSVHQWTLQSGGWILSLIYSIHNDEGNMKSNLQSYEEKDIKTDQNHMPPVPEPFN